MVIGIYSKSVIIIFEKQITTSVSFSIIGGFQIEILVCDINCDIIQETLSSKSI